jgi:hypothetical protein
MSERNYPMRSSTAGSNFVQTGPYGFAGSNYLAGTIGATYAGNWTPSNWRGNGWNASAWPNNAWTGNYYYPGYAVVPSSTFGFPTNGFYSFYTPFVSNNICASNGDCAPGAACFATTPGASLGTCLPSMTRDWSNYYP